MSSITPRELAEFLVHNGHLGKQNSIKSYEIASQLSIDEKQHDSTNSVTRETIRDAIVELYVPIGSYWDGYYVINCGDEVDETMQGLQSSIGGLERRMEITAIAWNKWRRGESLVQP